MGPSKQHNRKPTKQHTKSLSKRLGPTKNSKPKKPQLSTTTAAATPHDMIEPTTLTNSIDPTK